MRLALRIPHPESETLSLALSPVRSVPMFRIDTEGLTLAYMTTFPDLSLSFNLVERLIGAAGHVLRFPPCALAASAQDERGRVALRRGAATDHGGQAVRAGGNRAAVIWNVLQSAEQTVRSLNAPEWLPAVYAGNQYVDGVQKNRVAQQEVAA